MTSSEIIIKEFYEFNLEEGYLIDSVAIALLNPTDGNPSIR